MGSVIGLAMAAMIGWVEDPSPLPTEPPIDPQRVTPGLLGLLSFLFLIVAVVLLYLSMRKQMRKVDPRLPNGPGDEGREARAEDELPTEQAEDRVERQADGGGDSASPDPDDAGGQR